MTQEYDTLRNTSSGNSTSSLKAKSERSVRFFGFFVGGVAFGFSNACVGIGINAVVGALSQQVFCALVACIFYTLCKREHRSGPEVTCASLVAAALSLLPFLFINGANAPQMLISCHVVQFIALAVFFVTAFCHERMHSGENRIAVALAWSFAGVGIGWIVSAATIYNAGLPSVFLHAATSVIITALVACALTNAFTFTRAARQTHSEEIAENNLPTDSETPDMSDETERPAEQACSQLARQADLSRREEQVLVLLSHGKSAGDIATELVVSGNTVKTHVRNVYRKLDVHSREELDHLLAVGIENNQQNRQLRTGTSIESNQQKPFM